MWLTWSSPQRRKGYASLIRDFLAEIFFLCEGGALGQGGGCNFLTNKILPYPKKRMFEVDNSPRLPDVARTSLKLEILQILLPKIKFLCPSLFFNDTSLGPQSNRNISKFKAILFYLI